MDITYADKDKNASDGREKFTDADANEIKQAVNSKVDQVAGKGLSSNDFTDSYKSKLDNQETFNYQINLETTQTEFYNDITVVAETITSVKKSPGINTIQYRKNGGAWSSIYPVSRGINDVLDWKVTYNATYNKGSFIVNGTKV